MEFLVRIDIDLPSGMPASDLEHLTEAERVRGQELMREGKLARIWRVPGRRANISLYDVKDATDLHAALASLPLWPWMSIDVQALAQHPLESAC